MLYMLVIFYLVSMAPILSTLVMVNPWVRYISRDPDTSYASYGICTPVLRLSKWGGPSFGGITCDMITPLALLLLEYVQAPRCASATDPDIYVTSFGEPSTLRTSRPLVRSST